MTVEWVSDGARQLARERDQARAERDHYRRQLDEAWVNVERLRAERDAVINLVNLYGDLRLGVLDDAGLLKARYPVHSPGIGESS